jgi:hypothetical protein
MNIVRSVFELIFTYIFYPIAVLSIFGYILHILILILQSAKSEFGLFRRAVGAALPFISMIFMVAAMPELAKVIERLLNITSWYTRFGVGTLAGILLMELSPLFQTEKDALGSLFAAVFSSIGVFLAWSFISGILGSLNEMLLGFVVASSLHFIFRGSEKFWIGDN